MSILKCKLYDPFKKLENSFVIIESPVYRYTYGDKKKHSVIGTYANLIYVPYVLNVKTYIHDIDEPFDIRMMNGETVRITDEWDYKTTDRVNKVLGKELKEVSFIILNESREELKTVKLYANLKELNDRIKGENSAIYTYTQYKNAFNEKRIDMNTGIIREGK